MSEPAGPMPRLQWLGDSALLLHLGEGIDPALNARVHALAAWLGPRLPASWRIEPVPAFASLGLFWDAQRCDDRQLQARVQELLQAWLEREGHAGARAPEAPAPAAPGPCAREHRIAVRYGGEDGPDLAALAAHAGLSIDEVVARHTAASYQVAMVGFQPGFPYLLGLDPALAMPRRAAPRTRVPAGSVAIGGAQCGIYPGASPGGWQLIGRTQRVLFDSAAQPPALLRAGDRVRFHVAASSDRYDAARGAA